MALAETGHLEIDDARLEYRLHRASSVAGAIVVMLHEGLGCVAAWRDFPRQIGEATGCDVLAYSRAGYGGSSPCTLPRPLRYMHDEALEVLPGVLARLDGRPVVLLGHSDGASIAAIHAGTRRDTGIVGLVLIAPHFFTEDSGLAAIAAAARAYRESDLRTRLVRYHGDNVDCAFHGWSGAWLDPGFRAWDIREHLAGIAAPVLVIQGDADEYGTTAQIDAVRDGCRSPVQVEMLAACGHSPHRDQPQRTLALVRDFVRRLGVSSASAAPPPRSD